MKKLEIDQMALIARAKIAKDIAEFEKNFFSLPGEYVTDEQLKQEVANGKKVQDQRQSRQLVYPS